MSDIYPPGRRCRKSTNTSMATVSWNLACLCQAQLGAGNSVHRPPSSKVAVTCCLSLRRVLRCSARSRCKFSRLCLEDSLGPQSIPISNFRDEFKMLPVVSYLYISMREPRLSWWFCVSRQLKAHGGFPCVWLGKHNFTFLT